MLGFVVVDVIAAKTVEDVNGVGEVRVATGV